MGNLVKYGEYTPEAAQQEEKDSKSAGGAGFVKLQPGKNVVRILPPAQGRTSPFRVIYQHYLRVAGAEGPVVFVCPRQEAKRPCPVCKEADRLKRSGNPADRDRAGELFPSRRVFANAVDRSDPEGGVKVLVVGKTVHESLIAIRKDADAGGDFTHPTKGFDIIIERTGTGKQDTRYTVRPARNSTPLSADAKQMDEWLSSMRDLEEHARVLDQEELEAKLGGTDDADAPAPRRPSRTAEDDAAQDADFDDLPPKKGGR